MENWIREENMINYQSIYIDEAEVSSSDSIFPIQIGSKTYSQTHFQQVYWKRMRVRVKIWWLISFFYSTVTIRTFVPV